MKTTGREMITMKHKYLVIFNNRTKVVEKRERIIAHACLQGQRIGADRWACSCTFLFPSSTKSRREKVEEEQNRRQNRSPLLVNFVKGEVGPCSAFPPRGEFIVVLPLFLPVPFTSHSAQKTPTGFPKPYPNRYPRISFISFPHYFNFTLIF